MAEAEADLDAARADLEILRQAVSDMAVASYVHPPAVDLVESFSAATFSDALVQQTYLDARASRDADLLDLYDEATSVAAQRAEQLAAAADAADAAVAEANAALGDLQAEQQRQAAFADQVQDRIGSKLAEAQALAELDAELAAEIEAENQALIAQLPPDPPVTPVSAGPATPAPSGGTGSSGGSPTPTSPPPTSPPATAPPSTSPPTTTPTTTPPSISSPPLRTVQGITVHADIADRVDAMITAARADGIILGGGGYRSPDSQIATRRANCGTSYYAIYEAPSSYCSPPTARPGTSMHERGLAIDLTSSGSLIRSRSTSAFQWLQSNAASYGLYNYPVEPWHWSTTGG